jgi:DNA polymerase-3 subunit delta
MADLTSESLIARIAAGDRGGNYFLDTGDAFLRDEAIDLIARAHLEGGSPDFDLDQIGGQDADPATLASLLQTPPVLSDYRVVVIRDAQGLRPTARTVVESAVKSHVEGRVLVIAAEIPRASKARFYGVLRECCTTVSLAAPRPSELPGWLVERASSLYGVALEVGAAQLLAAGIGVRLGVLAQELEKIVTLVDPGSSIGIDDVRASVGTLPQVDRWEWIDKVAEGRVGEALSETRALLDSGESGVGLIGWLSESLLRVGLALDGENVLVRVLKRDGSYARMKWKVGAYRRQSKAWTAEQIDAALEELLRADRLIKSGGLSGRAALEEALLRIAALRVTPADERAPSSLAGSRC